MLKNYIHSAQERFEKERKVIEEQQQKRSASHPVRCVNAGCSLYGTITTNYLCSKCFAKQKEHAATLDRARQKASTLPKFLAGKSKFYTEVSFSERELYGSQKSITDQACLPTLQEAALTTLQTELVGEKTKRLMNGNGKSSSLPRSTYPKLIESLQPEPCSKILKTNEVVDIDKIVVTVKTVSPTASAKPPSGVKGSSILSKLAQVNPVKPASEAQINTKLQYGQQKQTCKTKGCHALGNEDTDFLCDDCYRERNKLQPHGPYIISHRI